MPISKLGVASPYEPLCHARVWDCYGKLPQEIQELADKNFELLRHDSSHPSLQLKRIGKFWSARVGLRYRALAWDRAEGLVWFWIGHHKDYGELLKH